MNNRYNFQSNLLKVSAIENMDFALYEWYFLFKEKREKIDGHCICSHKIKYVNYLVNAENHMTISVGDDCLKKFPNIKRNYATNSYHGIYTNIVRHLIKGGEYREILNMDDYVNQINTRVLNHYKSYLIRIQTNKELLLKLLNELTNSICNDITYLEPIRQLIQQYLQNIEDERINLENMEKERIRIEAIEKERIRLAIIEKERIRLEIMERERIRLEIIENERIRLKQIENEKNWKKYQNFQIKDQRQRDQLIQKQQLFENEKFQNQLKKRKVDDVCHQLYIENYLICDCGELSIKKKCRNIHDPMYDCCYYECPNVPSRKCGFKKYVDNNFEVK
jgi:hypothetical protein